MQRSTLSKVWWWGSGSLLTLAFNAMSLANGWRVLLPVLSADQKLDPYAVALLGLPVIHGGSLLLLIVAALHARRSRARPWRRLPAFGADISPWTQGLQAFVCLIIPLAVAAALTLKFYSGAVCETTAHEVPVAERGCENAALGIQLPHAKRLTAPNGSSLTAGDVLHGDWPRGAKLIYQGGGDFILAYAFFPVLAWTAAVGLAGWGFVEMGRRRV